jgi:Uma2 family endonuclease
MTTATRPITLEEFMALPEPAEGHLELIAGEVVYVSGGNSIHGRVIGNILAATVIFVRAHNLGRVLNNANFHIGDDPPWAPVPDITYISHERFAEIDRGEAFFEGAPDLAIEVVSESNSSRDMTGKIVGYLQAGGSRVWQADPRSGTVTVHRADWTARTFRSGETLTSDDAGFEVEGFTLNVDDIFA